MKGAIIGGITLICVVAATLFFAYSTAVGSQPDPDQVAQPIATPATLETYVGNLTDGMSYFQNAQALVEITFEDGRVFIGTEEMARQANMQIGKIYQITFSSQAPGTALSIQEKQP